MRTSGALIIGLGVGLSLGSGPALTQGAPLSAIDWLSDSVAAAEAAPGPPLDEPAVAGAAGIETITVTPLGEISADAVGLLPVSVTGLPRDLWGGTPSADLARLLQGLDTGLPPALQDLLYTLLLAELDPPADSDPSGALFLARIDTLLRFGAVEQAQALLNRAGPDDPGKFRRWFDASLLTGTENAACDRLRAAADLSPTLPARIFCLARGGDWNAAALTLDTGRALGEMTGAEDAVLTRFLDAESFEGVPRLPVPARPSPLMFRLFEAIGEPLTTTTLPPAFANADLNPNAGWKAQLEAAERLARTGAIDENRLLGLYTERLPAASGGVWDRVAALQRFDAALTAGDPAKVAETLPRAWRSMRAVSLEVVFARLYAADLRRVPLAGSAGTLAFRIGLLSRDYEAAAETRAPETAEDRFLKALTRGDLAGVTPADETATAIAEGFQTTAAPPRLAAEVARGELGLAILQAVGLAADGVRGDLAKLSDALALFRAVGLEDIARRLALQVMILERRA